MLLVAMMELTILKLLSDMIQRGMNGRMWHLWVQEEVVLVLLPFMVAYMLLVDMMEHLILVLQVCIHALACVAA